MAIFRQKRISRSQTLGDKINKKRLEESLSLSVFSQQTKIQEKYLQALEEGNYQLLPGDVYAKSWIKICADILDLNYRELLTDYKLEKSLKNKLQPLSKSKTKKEKFYFLNPKNFKLLGIALGFLLLLGYLVWEIHSIIAPPKVIIFEPANNFRTTESSVVIIGETKPEVELKINNEKILLNEDGTFYQEISLIVGLNNLQISAKKKHSQINSFGLFILRESL